MNNVEHSQLERLFGSNPHLKATMEQTCHFGRSHPATKETQPIFRDKPSLLGYVVQRAKKPWDIPIDKVNKISIKYPEKRSS